MVVCNPDQAMGQIYLHMSFTQCEPKVLLHSWDGTIVNIFRDIKNKGSVSKVLRCSHAIVAGHILKCTTGIARYILVSKYKKRFIARELMIDVFHWESQSGCMLCCLLELIFLLYRKLRQALDNCPLI